MKIELKDSIQNLNIDGVHKNFFFLFSVIFSFSISLNAQEIIPMKSKILNESKLSILGTSNVTDFECLYEDNFEIDQLSHALTMENGIINVNGDTLKLSINDFDCGKKGINKDFRKSLNADEYSSIDISLLSFKPSKDLLEEVKVLISLAGSEQKYLLEFKSIYQDDGIIRIDGEQELSMSDFNIDPPKALFGLIKVRNELTIKFTLYLKTL